jgi:hypothetical protein
VRRGFALLDPLLSRSAPVVEAEAWKEVAQVRTLGFQVPQQFIDGLSQQMPEPERR